MDNALYVGLSQQMVLQRELDIVANNLANADTTGFKVEVLIDAGPTRRAGLHRCGGHAAGASSSSTTAWRATSARARCARPARRSTWPSRARASSRSNRQGRRRATPATAASRTDATGQLVDPGRRPGADDGGGEITLDPQKPARSPSPPDGIVSQGGRARRQGRRGQLRQPVGAREGRRQPLQNASNQQPHRRRPTPRCARGCWKAPTSSRSSRSPG